MEDVANDKIARDLFNPVIPITDAEQLIGKCRPQSSMYRPNFLSPLREEIRRALFIKIYYFDARKNKKIVADFSSSRRIPCTGVIKRLRALESRI